MRWGEASEPLSACAVLLSSQFKAGGGTRTRDLGITSASLCRLSYAGSPLNYNLRSRLRRAAFTKEAKRGWGAKGLLLNSG